MKKTTLLFSGLMLMSIIAFAKQYVYTFNTTCGTSITVQTNSSISDTELRNKLNAYNLEYCGHIPADMDIVID